MNTTFQPPHVARDIDDMARRAADRADSAIDSAQRVTDGALETLHDKVSDLRDASPRALRRAAEQLDELKRRGIEAARQAKLTVQDQALRASDRTVGYIKEEPVKSILVAAAAGAAAVLLISLLSRSRSTPQR